jgi:hypothetical protein
MTRPVHYPALLSLLLAGLLIAVALPAGAQEPPHPDPAFLHQSVPAGPCVVENEYEANIYGLEVGDVRYGDKCKRIKFAFGPIVVKPGENDALIEPVTIEKPAYTGYITRFKPDLVRALDGESPPTDDMHLHHATWLNAYPSYGRGPFFASGEEKTIATFPDGYGMRVGAMDTWLLLYMVHNDITTPEVVWLTYDIDYIADGDAAEFDMVPIKPLWLDVQNPRIHPEAPNTSSNPVFNVQRGFGTVDPDTGRLVCTWPKENCARHDSYGMVTPNQGKTVDNDGNPISIGGTDWRVTADMAGTIVGLGGHLHFGGLRDEVSLVRDGVEKPIFISDAIYWDWQQRDPERVGAPPWSWDFSMTVTGSPDWKVKIKQGDIIRINAVTDAEDASWYEGMGIVVGYVAPLDDPHAPAGVDVFDDDVVIDPGVPDRMLVPPGPWDVKNGWVPDTCTPDLTGASGQKRLCLRGQVTHGPMEESSNHSGGCPPTGCPDLPDVKGDVTDEIVSVGFTYGNADLGVIEAMGMPQVRKDQPVRLWNADTVGRIWHTYTRCAYPCNGPKDMNYPRADGGRGDPDDVMDFDSNEIGYGTFFEPASGQFPPSYSGKSPQQAVRDGLYTEFTPTETGVYTFFCRIHKSMRGAFEVVE